jgi:hypothetical protein
LRGCPHIKIEEATIGLSAVSEKGAQTKSYAARLKRKQPKLGGVAAKSF